MTANEDPGPGVSFSVAPGWIRVTGELDVAALETFTRLVDEAVSDGPAVVDLTDVTFVDLCTVAALVDASERAVHLSVRNPPPSMRRVLDVLGWGDAIDVSYVEQFSIVGLGGDGTESESDVTLDAASARDLDLFIARVSDSAAEGTITRPVVAWHGTQRVVINVHVTRTAHARWQIQFGERRADDDAPDVPEAVDPRLDDLTTMVWVTDADRLARWFNTAWLEFVGADLADELGWGWMRHLHPDDLVSLMEVYEAAQTEQRGFEHVARVIDRAGDAVSLQVRATARLDGGTFGGFVGMCEPTGVVERLSRVEAALEITRPAETIEAAFLRRLVSHWVGQHEGLSARHDDIVLAVGEAASNTMVHAYRDQHGRVRLTCALHPGAAEFRVRDWGVWLPPSPTRDSRGISLMHMLADNVRIEHLPDGTEAVLQFSLQT